MKERPVIIPIETIKALLNRPIAFHRIFADIGGGAAAGLMLSQMWYWSQRTNDPAGWFYKTAGDWEMETALTRKEQQTARKQLVIRGLLEEELRGLPAKLYYRLNFEAVGSAISGDSARYLVENSQ